MDLPVNIFLHVNLVLKTDKILLRIFRVEIRKLLKPSSFTLIHEVALHLIYNLTHIN